MRVLLCPDKFRGTASARRVAEALQTGWRRVRPDDDLRIVPMADGGEGTIDALATADAARLHVDVSGPLGDPVEADLALRHGGVAVIESARASGLELLSSSRRDPRRTTTRGVGELMRVALDRGARSLLVCLGGSATNDGGAGMAAALGVRLLDDGGRPIRDGGAALLELARIDTSALDPRLRSVDVVGLTDVDNPLVGPRGASTVFGPQKGASPDDVWTLDRALAHLAAVVRRDLGTERASEPGAGAAGGLGFGLLAFAGARLRPGAEAVADAVGLEEEIVAADLVVTGEGALDATSFGTKVVGTVLKVAELARTPVALVCGRADVDASGLDLTTLVELVGEERALEGTTSSLEEVGVVLAERVGAQRTRSAETPPAG